MKGPLFFFTMFGLSVSDKTFSDQFHIRSQSICLLERKKPRASRGGFWGAVLARFCYNRTKKAVSQEEKCHTVQSYSLRSFFCRRIQKVESGGKKLVTLKL